MAEPCRFGCPFWAFADWRGTLYSADARPADFLAQYARVFGTVEGNTTFYSTPAPSTVRRWRDETPTGFRFCFKLPQRITHELELVGAEAEATAFLKELAPLGDRLGPFMIQLPARFRADALPRLERFIASLPAEFDYAVELRNPAFFDPGDPAADRVDAMLEAHGCGRVVMDTRALRSGDPRHEDVVQARHKKPDLPLRLSYTGDSPLVRIVFHPDEAVNTPFLEEWATRVARWARAGTGAYVFFHTPSNRDTPALLQRFYASVATRADLAPLATFLGESGETAGGQLRLL